MQGYIAKGHAELVSESCEEGDGREWYLPHFPVLNPKKPDKLRIVFDCAAKYMGISLNDVLMQGPDLVNSLEEVLIRFCEEHVALVADIEAMLHQVRVNSEDRDSLKFLWWPNGDTSIEPKTYRMAMHLFGAVSSTSCSVFALRQTVSSFVDGRSVSAMNAIQHGFYGDNCLISIATEKEAIEALTYMCAILSQGGFNLTKWLCNNDNVMRMVPEQHRSKLAKTLPLDDSTREKVLGVYWEVGSDTFRMKVNIPDKPYQERSSINGTLLV